MLRIKVFVEQHWKITLTINRGFFMTFVNVDCSQTLAMQTNRKLNLL